MFQDIAELININIVEEVQSKASSLHNEGSGQKRKFLRIGFRLILCREESQRKPVGRSE